MAKPVNLVTGFLGVGKTTAVVDLLRRKPAGERWAVLVNEYGEVGIDAALIEGAGTQGVSVREISGGCMCCTSALELPVSLHFLLTESKPDRLLIETTGLGHPAQILDFLRVRYAGELEVRATLGLVTPRDLATPGMLENRVFLDQVHLADVLVLNKLDTATGEQVDQFQVWAGGLYPPKLLIAAATEGHIDPAWLDLTARDERFPGLPVVPAPGHIAPRPVAVAEVGRPLRYPSGTAAVGWVFAAGEIFDRDQLTTFFARDDFGRAKGVFRTAPGEWVAVNRSGASERVTVTPVAYRRDSRCELFASDRTDWPAVERALMRTVQSGAEPVQ